MGELIFLFILVFIWLLAASISDLKKREVPNWLSFSLIVFAFAFRLFYSVLNADFWFLLNGVIGFGVFFGFAYLFYYGRVFAGGDAKLLMALGSVLPFTSSLYQNFFIFIVFILLLLIVGSIYGLIYSLVLVVLNTKKFSSEFMRQFKTKRRLFLISLIFFFLFFIFIIFIKEISLFVFPFLILLFPILYVYAKAVEEACLVKYVDVKDVTIGDWLYEEVRIKKKKIKPYWEGLNEEDLELLKKYKKKVLIKQGIPFVPVFLIAFSILIYLWYSSPEFFNFLWFS